MCFIKIKKLHYYRNIFQGQYLAQKDTILVTAQYRLGALGYLTTAQKDASGNVGLFDLRAAMAWVNIFTYLLSLNIEEELFRHLIYYKN